jgi:cytochrome c biogenesis protein CcmG, thiol:disulfide interchange protein DsbE
MYEKFSGNGLNMVAVNGFDTAEVAKKFRTEFKLTMPFALGGTDEKSVSRSYGVMAYPTTYILDKDGVVKARYVGDKTKEMLKVLAELGIE